MKSLNEQSKIYGLRAKPTTSVEFPSGNLVRYLVELVLVVFLFKWILYTNSLSISYELM